MDSTPAIQGNIITQNTIGIFFLPADNPVPFIGGGGGSTGGNTFDNSDES
jgi:hypothetical protein